MPITMNLLVFMHERDHAAAAPVADFAETLLVAVARLKVELPRPALVAIGENSLENLPVQKLVRRQHDKNP